MTSESAGHPNRPHGHHRSIDPLDAKNNELEAEALVTILDQCFAKITDVAGASNVGVRRIADLGCGAGVGAVALSDHFDADVIGVDESPVMLGRAQSRIDRLGASGRCRVARRSLPEGLDGLEPVDLVWASMVLHHIEDPCSFVSGVRSLLGLGGLLAVVEFGEPMRFMPTSDIAGVEFEKRFAATIAEWVATIQVDALPTVLAANGFELVVDQPVEARIDAPLDEGARRSLMGRLVQQGRQVVTQLNELDADFLQRLVDPEDPAGVMKRADLRFEVSRRLYLAKAIESGSDA